MRFQLPLIALIWLACLPVAAQLVPVGPEQVINTVTSGHQFPTRISCEPGGGFLVLWGGGLSDDVSGRRLDASGTPTGP